MASSLQTQISQFILWKTDRGAIVSNAFHIPWASIEDIFSPFSLIATVLVKMEFESMSFWIIVLPTWKTQHWYTRLLKLLVAPPLLLPKSVGYSKLQENPAMARPEADCILIMQSSLQITRFRKSLKHASWTLGETQKNKYRLVLNR